MTSLGIFEGILKLMEQQNSCPDHGADRHRRIHRNEQQHTNTFNQTAGMAIATLTIKKA
jgi:hypothetical protein